MPSAGFKPKKLASKALTSVNMPGTNFTVDVQQLDDDPIVWEVTVTDGAGIVYVERHTTGDSTSSGAAATAPLSLATLQAELDGHRQNTCDRFAWKRAAATLTPLVT
jgi:hypothetical protein